MSVERLSFCRFYILNACFLLSIGKSIECSFGFVRHNISPTKFIVEDWFSILGKMSARKGASMQLKCNSKYALYKTLSLKNYLKFLKKILTMTVVHSCCTLYEKRLLSGH